MILIEMILLWCSLFTTATLGICVLTKDKNALLWLCISAGFITLYVTLIRHVPVIRDSVVFG